MRHCVIIPCFNEEAAIKKVYDDVRRYLPPKNIIVVDDGSTDRTPEILTLHKIQNIRHSRNLGIGGAVQTGYIWALKNEFDFSIQIDGDGQHPADQISQLITKFRSTGADLIIGSRYLYKKSQSTTYMRMFGTKILNSFINLCYPKSMVTDSTSGLRLTSKKLMEYFSQKYPRDYPEPIAVAIALSKGLLVVETSVTMRRRVSGKSSINRIDQIIYMIRVLGFICVTKIQSKIR